MKCERCGAHTKGHDLHDYCAVCSKNLCETCLRDGRCFESENKLHKPANHGTCTSCGACHVDGVDCFGEPIA